MFLQWSTGTVLPDPSGSFDVEEANGAAANVTGSGMAADVYDGCGRRYYIGIRLRFQAFSV